MTIPAAAVDQPRGSLVLMRHGETQWSRSGRHTGHTDIALTARGEQLGAQTGELIKGRLDAPSPFSE